jgi:hypothetical protein
MSFEAEMSESHDIISVRIFTQKFYDGTLTDGIIPVPVQRDAVARIRPSTAFGMTVVIYYGKVNNRENQPRASSPTSPWRSTSCSVLRLSLCDRFSNLPDSRESGFLCPASGNAFLPAIAKHSVCLDCLN